MVRRKYLDIEVPPTGDERRRALQRLYEKHADRFLVKSWKFLSSCWVSVVCLIFVCWPATTVLLFTWHWQIGLAVCPVKKRKPTKTSESKRDVGVQTFAAPSAVDVGVQTFAAPSAVASPMLCDRCERTQSQNQFLCPLALDSTFCSKFPWVCRDWLDCRCSLALLVSFIRQILLLLFIETRCRNSCKAKNFGSSKTRWITGKSTWSSLAKKSASSKHSWPQQDRASEGKNEHWCYCKGVVIMLFFWSPLALKWLPCWSLTGLTMWFMPLCQVI